MKLAKLTEGRVNYGEPGWERTVKPTPYYVGKSAEPFRYWTVEDMVPMLTKLAGYAARGVIKKFEIDEAEFDNLVQAGLEGAIQKARQLVDRDPPLHGVTLAAIFRNNMYGWIRRSHPKSRRPSRALERQPLPIRSHRPGL